MRENLDMTMMMMRDIGRYHLGRVKISDDCEVRVERNSERKKENKKKCVRVPYVTITWDMD